MKLTYLASVLILMSHCLLASNHSTRDESVLIPRAKNLQSNTFSAIAPFSLEALKRYPNIDVGVLSPDGIPEFIAGDLGSIKKSPSVAEGADIIKGAFKALEVIGLSRAKFTLVLKTVENTGDGHFKFTCSYKGIEIAGSEIVIHVRSDGSIFCLNGDIPDVRALDKLSIKGKKSKTEIASTCQKYYRGTAAMKDSPSLVFHHSSRDRGTRLAWKTEAKSDEAETETLYVDDSSGLITDIESHKHHALTRTLCRAGGPMWVYSQTTNFNTTPATISVTLSPGSTIIETYQPDYYRQYEYPESYVATSSATQTFNFFTTAQGEAYNEQCTIIINATNRYNEIPSGRHRHPYGIRENAKPFIIRALRELTI